MTSLVGYYQRTWTGTANRNLPKQSPLIAKHFPAINNFHAATVNIRFEEKILVAGYEHRTPPIDWRSPKPPETFDLLHVRLRFDRIEGSHNALWYVAHGSVHRLDPHKHEFLVERYIDGLTHGLRVRLEIDRQTVELPYTVEDVGEHGPRRARTIVVL
jgi:hypothetical protein